MKKRSVKAWAVFVGENLVAVELSPEETELKIAFELNGTQTASVVPCVITYSPPAKGRAR